MREQASMVMFPDKNGKPWSPPRQGNGGVSDVQTAATGFPP